MTATRRADAAWFFGAVAAGVAISPWWLSPLARRIRWVR